MPSDGERGAGHYAGAGDGQCVAVKDSDGERCTNGVYGSNVLCGTHKNASDVDLAPDQDSQEWLRCPDCGWQPALYGGPGSAPWCSHCSTEPPLDAARWADRGFGLTCGYCGDDLPTSPRQAVEDDKIDEVVGHIRDPDDDLAVSETVWFCDPQCAANEWGGSP